MEVCMFIQIVVNCIMLFLLISIKDNTDNTSEKIQEIDDKLEDLNDKVGETLKPKKKRQGG